MELLPGYKNTDVGVIPQDWDVARMETLLAGPIQNGVFNEPSRKGRGNKLINVIDLYGSFPLNTDALERFDATQDEVLRFGVRHGDIFFTRSSLTSDGIAQCNVFRAAGDETVVFDCHIIRVRPNGEKSEPFFLARYCTSRPARRFLVTNAKTTTMTTIDQSVIAKLPVALPPLPEQRAIAEALSDVDGLLGGLDRLIAKKRDLKQAAMQQLLTGQTRLPGFHGDWDVKRLGDVTDTDPENLGSDTRPDFAFNYISLEDVDQGTLRGYSEQVFRTAPSRARRKLRDKDVLVSTVRPNLKSHLLFQGNGQTWICSTGFCVVRCRENQTHPGYVFFHMFGHLVARQIEALLTGSNYPAINSGDVRALEIPFPNFAEQTAIAEVLTEMDLELAALEQRREKTRALKQAMMQELLTGRIRLV
jgi:type I restriction enzyme S subunit